MTGIFFTMIYIGGVLYHMMIDGVTWWSMVLWPMALGMSLAHWGEQYGIGATDDKEQDNG
jgi:hypothetical protein